MTDRRGVLPVVAVMGFVMLAMTAFVFVTVPRFSPLHVSATWEEELATKSVKETSHAHAALAHGLAKGAEVTQQKSDSKAQAMKLATHSQNDGAQKANSRNADAQKADAQRVDAHSTDSKPTDAASKPDSKQSKLAAKSTKSVSVAKAKEDAVDRAKKLSEKVKSSVQQLGRINVPGVSKHSDAQLDQMAEVYFRKLNDKKNDKKVTKIVKHTAEVRAKVKTEAAKKAAIKQKTETSLKANKQKLAQKKAEKVQDRALDKEAEKFYQQYQKKKSNLAKLAQKKTEKAITEKKAVVKKAAANKAQKVSPADLKKEKAKQAAEKAQAQKLARKKAKLAAEKEDKQMDIEAEKLYHQYVQKKEKKSQKLKQAAEKQKEEQHDALKKKLAKVKRAPVHKKMLESDAKLDKTAEHDYQKFVKLKQQKEKAKLAQTTTVKKNLNSATKTEAKVEKKAKKLNDHKLDKTAEKDYKLFQKLKKHRNKLENAKKQALQSMHHTKGDKKLDDLVHGKHNSKDSKAKKLHTMKKGANVKKAAKVDLLKTDANRDKTAKVLYHELKKQREAKAKLHHKAKFSAVSDEEQAEKRLNKPNLKQMKPMKPAQLHQLEKVEAKKLKEMKKLETSNSASSKKAKKAASHSQLLSKHQLKHLVSIEHKQDEKAHKLGMDSDKKSTTHSEQQMKPLNRKQLSQLEQRLHPRLHKIPTGDHEKTLPHVARPVAHKGPTAQEKLLTKAATKPLSPTELAKLEHVHMQASPKAAKTQLSEASVRETTTHVGHVSEKQRIQKAVKSEKPMSADQLSKLEDLHDKMMDSSKSMRTKLSVKHMMEKADESQLALTSEFHHSSRQGRQGAKRSSALAKLKPHHGLGIAKLLDSRGIKEEVGTQKLVQTSLTELPDDFIPKDSPAYQMIMQARMAAQQEQLAVQNHVVEVGAAKNAYNDKMKKLDEKNMLSQPRKARFTMLDQDEDDDESTFDGDSLAEDDEENFSGDSLAEDSNDRQTMLAQTQDSDGLDADSASPEFDTLAENDNDSDPDGGLDSPTDSYNGNKALMLGSM